MMEEQKLRYLQLLLKSKNENSADKYVTAIRLLEQEACRCYAKPISPTVNEMIEMMLLEELREARVKVEKVVEEGNLFAIKFQTGVLQIPPLTIEDITESFFRNLITYEQYCIDNHLSYVPDYVRFVDCLIDSPKDVEIPSQSGIINNWLGDDEVVSRIFNKISDAVTVPSNHFRCGDIFNKIPFSNSFMVVSVLEMFPWPRDTIANLFKYPGNHFIITFPVIDDSTTMKYFDILWSLNEAIQKFHIIGDIVESIIRTILLVRNEVSEE
ncbi:hypothetical protein ACSBR2_030521 [Camellia fascicularis]